MRLSFGNKRSLSVLVLAAVCVFGLPLCVVPKGRYAEAAPDAPRERVEFVKAFVACHGEYVIVVETGPREYVAKTVGEYRRTPIKVVADVSPDRPMYATTVVVTGAQGLVADEIHVHSLADLVNNKP